MLRTTKIIITATLFLLFSNAVSAQYNRVNARQFLNKTSFIIGEAYDMAYYYNYYSSGYLSKAINNQRYAKWLFDVGNYRKSVIYSNIARRYALNVIYSCDNYWTNYYRPTYYSHYYGYGNHYGHYHGNHYNNHGYNNNHGNNHGNNNHGNNYGNNNHGNNNTTYGHRDNVGGGSNGSTVNGGAPRTTPNLEYDKYCAPADNNGAINERTFEDWESAYYSHEERDFIKDLPATLNAELTAELEKSPITAYREDKAVAKTALDELKTDIDSYKTTHVEEARQMSIARPKDFNTTETETRASAGKQLYPTPTVRPVEAKPTAVKPASTITPAARPVEIKPTTTTPTTRPVETRPTTTTPTARPAEAKPTTTTPTTRPVETKPTTTKPATTTTPTTRPAETKPTTTKPATTKPASSTSKPTTTTTTTTTTRPATTTTNNTSKSSSNSNVKSNNTQKTTNTTSNKSIRN